MVIRHQMSGVGAGHPEVAEPTRDTGWDVIDVPRSTRPVWGTCRWR